MTPTTDANHLRAEMAVMCIYRNLNVPADTSLSLAELEHHWSDYGVRSSDLPWAIDGLVRKGFLSRQHGSPEQIARTVAGENWFDQQPAWLEYHLLQPRLSRVRFLRSHGPRKPIARRRRRVDQAPPTSDIYLGVGGHQPRHVPDTRFQD